MSISLLSGDEVLAWSRDMASETCKPQDNPRALFLPWPLCASISLQCVLLSVAWNSGSSVCPLQMQKYLCRRVPHKDKWKFYFIVKALWGVLFAWHLRNTGGDPGPPLAPSLSPTPFSYVPRVCLLFISSTQHLVFSSSFLLVQLLLAPQPSWEVTGFSICTPDDGMEKEQNWFYK